jgi:hypothetical protein
MLAPKNLKTQNLKGSNKMKTDTQKTGKLYPLIFAYNATTGEYFATTAQFKTCTNFKTYLESKYSKQFKTTKKG